LIADSLPVSNTTQLRDLAASAARVFGWDKKEGPQTQINQLCISAEQLEQIRQLRDDPYKKPAISATKEGDIV
jgi:hypothetical protein